MDVWPGGGVPAWDYYSTGPSGRRLKLVFGLPLNFPRNAQLPCPFKEVPILLPCVFIPKKLKNLSTAQKCAKNRHFPVHAKVEVLFSSLFRFFYQSGQSSGRNFFWICVCFWCVSFLEYCTWWRGRPTMDGKTARGASSPANPALHIPDPLSTTKAATSSSHMMRV